MIDLLQEIYSAIMRNKMRTAATGFAVASGLFLIIVLQGAGNGIIHTFEQNMGQFAFNAIRVFGGMTTKPFEGMREGRFIQLDQRDVDMLRRTFPNHVTDVLPSVSQDGLTASRGEFHATNVELYGTYPIFARSQAVEVLQGRFINDIDIRQCRKVMVVSKRTADDFFPHGQDAIGQTLNVGGIAWHIVGIFKTDEMSFNQANYVPFTTLATIYHKGPFISSLTMNVRGLEKEDDMERFESDYIRATSHIHSFAPDDRQAMWIWNQAKDSEQLNTARRILHTAFWILGLLTLVSGVVGVSNIMLISVKERTREFGIRRAIGARPWSIIRMVMLESVVITGIFGYLGMLLGILFCEWMDTAVGGQTLDVGVFQMQYFVDPTVDLSTCLMATAIIIASGALAGFVPASKAMKVKPIDALRN